MNDSVIPHAKNNLKILKKYNTNYKYFKILKNKHLKDIFKSQNVQKYLIIKILLG